MKYMQKMTLILQRNCKCCIFGAEIENVFVTIFLGSKLKICSATIRLFTVQGSGYRRKFFFNVSTWPDSLQVSHNFPFFSSRWIPGVGCLFWCNCLWWQSSSAMKTTIQKSKRKKKKTKKTPNYYSNNFPICDFTCGSDHRKCFLNSAKVMSENWFSPTAAGDWRHY